MRRRRILALLALGAALLGVGATAELDQAFGHGAFAERAADRDTPLTTRDQQIAPTPPTHLTAVSQRGAGGNWLDHALRRGTAVLAAAALLAALASVRLGRSDGARRWRSFVTTALGRGPPRLIAI